jgi:hypothetical protein
MMRLGFVWRCHFRPERSGSALDSIAHGRLDDALDRDACDGGGWGVESRGVAGAWGYCW